MDFFSQAAGLLPGCGRPGTLPPPWCYRRERTGGDPEAAIADSRLDAEVRASPLGWRQRQIIPPLAPSVWPVIQKPSGPARKATVAAISFSADQEVITCRG